MSGPPRDGSEIQILAPGTLVGPERYLLAPENGGNVVASAHLGIVVLKECKDVSSRVALDYTLGYTICIRVRGEVYERDSRGLLSFYSEQGDSSLMIGPYIVDKAFLDLTRVRVTLYLNEEEILQDFDTGRLKVSPSKLISRISKRTTLPPGTLILSETKHTEISLKTYISPGDVLSASCQGIGTLHCRVGSMGRNGAQESKATEGDGLRFGGGNAYGKTYRTLPNCPTTETE
eukprot:CAMPEP_0184494344 /NCGR_PEP_ID=MMETSP0113_2-20130426/28484_1 /TAXON_ID=91329 /ORGANISM="Norrisiella sphaerica, Strain BC52" /LENGTH=232 /DNA_ID=CAMNT_0026880067 /DNA_START=65 /DNA_END=763 /DNA_ORIENTATION=-